MERVRVVVFGCLLALGLSFCPSAAYASDGFLGGLEDLTGNREVEEVKPEEQWNESYKPILKVQNEDEAELPEYEDGDDIGPIGSVVDSVQYIPLYTSKVHIVDMVRYFLGSSGAEAGGLPLVGYAAVLFFVWWGLRKSLRVMMAAFRKGKANV